MTTPGHHIADDTMLLERLALRQAADDERHAAEEHLAECERCRSALAEEEALAAGVRRYGRAHLKTRLRAMLAEEERTTLPWPHILSAAAVLIVLVGIGIYQQWVATHEPEQPQLPAITEHTATKMDQATAAAEGSGSPRPEQRVTTPDKETRSSSAARPSPVAPPAVTQRERPPEATPRDDRPEGHDKKVDLRVQETLQNKVIRLEGAKDRLGRADADMLAPKGVWVDGRVIPQLAGAARRKAEEQQVATAGGPRQTYRLRQHAQSQLAPQASAEVIPTLVERDSSVTRLTLFPGEPFDSAQLARARVEEITGDSIIVILDGRKISYHLPPTP